MSYCFRLRIVIFYNEFGGSQQGNGRNPPLQGEDES
jgi:hypothetical protein